MRLPVVHPECSRVNNQNQYRRKRKAGETQKKDGADAGDGHMGMGSMSTVDMNMGGRDIAGDDMGMGGMHEETANKNKSDYKIEYIKPVYSSLAEGRKVKLFIRKAPL